MVTTGTSFVVEFLQVPTGSPGGHKSPGHVESVCTQGWDNSTYLASVKSVSLDTGLVTRFPVPSRKKLAFN